MQLFFSHEVLNNQAFLDIEETRHCTKILRKQPGDIVCVTDGKGLLYKGVIVSFDKKKTIIDLTDQLPDKQKRSFSVDIAVAPTKNINRTEWLLEKSTEFGLDNAFFIRCQRSERKQIRVDRLQKIVLSAAKQSLKSTFPILTDLQDFKTFVSTAQQKQKFIAHCNTDDLPLFQNCLGNAEEVLVLIGPEGDFTPEEVAFAKENGFVEISLGKSRLRTETAAVAACHTTHIILG